MCKLLSDWFNRKQYGLDPPTITGVTNTEHIKRFISNAIEIKSPSFFIYTADNKKSLAPLSEYERMIQHSQTNQIKRKGEEWDCDNYAVAILGAFNIPKWSALPMGIVLCHNGQAEHMANIFIDDKTDVYILDDEHNEIFKPNKYHWTYHGVMFLY